MTIEERVFRIHTDGGARGNPGPAAIGYVIETPRGETLEFSSTIGTATNNQAEYRAIIAALEKVLALGAKEIELFSDSELVVNQLAGAYKVKNENLGTLFVQARSSLMQLQKFKLRAVPRELNKRADQLVNLALDGKN